MYFSPANISAVLNIEVTSPSISCVQLTTADLHITGLISFPWNNRTSKRGKERFCASWLHSAKLRGSARHVGRCYFPSSMCNGHFQLCLHLLVPTPKPGIKTEKSISQARVSISHGTSTTPSSTEMLDAGRIRPVGKAHSQLKAGGSSQGPRYLMHTWEAVGAITVQQLIPNLTSLERSSKKTRLASMCCSQFSITKI